MPTAARADLTPSSPVLLGALQNLDQRAHAVMERLRATVFAPDAQKTIDLRFAVGKAADMVGRSTEAIRQAEADGRLPAPRMTATGRREGYTLSDVNAMRDLFGTRPRRTADDPPLIIAVQNFKGGVGKSTLVCHLAQSLALKGYRVAVLDCDSQASTTTLFGFNPDADIDEDDTLLSFFRHGDRSDLRYGLRPTAWPGIDLLPANLGLYNAEYEAAARVRNNPRDFDRLRDGVEDLSRDYDVILLDPPPALGMISLAVLRAANALLIPTPPSTVDFASTSHFLRMVVETVEVLDGRLGARDFHFVKVVATKVDENKSAHVQIREMMLSVFGSEMLRASLLDSAEIDNANVQLRTVYEMSSGSKTHERCRNNLDRLNDEVELLIRRCWPSHRAALRQSGVA